MITESTTTIGALFDTVEDALAQGDCGCGVDGSHTFPETVDAYPQYTLTACRGVVALRELKTRLAPR